MLTDGLFGRTHAHGIGSPAGLPEQRGRGFHGVQFSKCKYNEKLYNSAKNLQFNFADSQTSNASRTLAL